MKPNYWENLLRNVDVKERRLQAYRRTNEGAMEYAKEIGRKYAETHV